VLLLRTCFVSLFDGLHLHVGPGTQDFNEGALVRPRTLYVQTLP